jgi:RNA polymerase sigma factor (sigma-70 family)
MASQRKSAAGAPASLSGHSRVCEADVSRAVVATPDEYSAALERIWRTSAQQILRVTQRITNNREDAEDALQDSFLRAYVYLHNFDGRSSLATWITRIAINSALLILRKRASGLQLSIDDADSGAVPGSLMPIDSSPSPEAQYAKLEQQAMLRSAIAMLRPSIRRALALQSLEGRSINETAETMGLSITATKSRIFQAKAALRRSLGPKVGRRSGGTRQLELSAA